MEKIYNFIFDSKFCVSLIIILIAIFIYELFKKLVNKIVKSNKDNQKITNKQKTYARLFNNILKYIFVLVILVLILQIYGINVNSIMAGLGVASVIAGLALQDALKDIIMGFNIIVDDYFTVGEVLKIGDIQGKVVQVGLKSTKIKDIDTNNFYVIANRNISEALKLSTQLDIDIPLPYEKKLEEIEPVIDEICNVLKENEKISDIEYKGIDKFDTSAIIYKIRMQCDVEQKPQIKRDSQRIVKEILDNNNISIPFTQIVIHNEK